MTWGGGEAKASREWVWDARRASRDGKGQVVEMQVKLGRWLRRKDGVDSGGMGERRLVRLTLCDDKQWSMD